MTSSGVVHPRPSPEEVQSIAATEDVCIRNLRITDCYARLSAAARVRVGEGANWCSFATWASRQAGCTIRGEDFGDRLADLIQGQWQARRPLLGLWRLLLRRGVFNPKTALGRIVRAVHSPFDAFERASEAVGAGNRKVFEEIGYEFARYLADPDLERFLGALKPGPPPDGQDLLRRAFRHYHAARTETRPARRAQLMLLANLEIGLHEQTRLQPEIRRAMEAAADTATGSPLTRPFRRFARDVTRIAISDVMMVLRMPDSVLALGRGLEAACPPLLSAIEEPELMALAATIEPSGCGDCGAEDWSDLPQRMHYIFHLFRAYHDRACLFDAPFTAAQTEAIRAGRLPDGRL